MSTLTYPDSLIRDVLSKVRTIAMVGASAKPRRPSHEVMKFLLEKGYRVIPVNPSIAGKTLLGETVYAALSDIGKQIDMVDIFRNSDAAGSIINEAIAFGAPIIWTQLDVINMAAAARAEKAGLTVIMDRCPKIEYDRLMGNQGWPG